MNSLFYKLFGVNQNIYNKVKLIWGENYLIISIVLVIGLFYLFSLFKDLSETGYENKKKFFTFSLAVIIWLIIIFISGLPQAEFYKIKYKPKTGVILIDNSYSMDIPVNRETREEFIKEKLLDDFEHLKKLNENIPIVIYSFGDTLTLLKKWSVGTLNKKGFVSVLKKIKGDESRSELANAVERLISSLGREKIGWLIIFTDGGFTDSFQDKELNYKIFSYPPRKMEIEDISIVKVDYPGIAYVRSPVTLSLFINLANKERQNSIINVFEDNKLIVSKQELIKRGTQKYDIDIRPNFTGEHIYRVSVGYLNNEKIKVNNSYSFTLMVLLDKIRVLHIIGRPSWDSRFLRLYLKNDPRIDMVSFTILRSNGDYPMARDDELSLIPFPTKTLFGKELNNFDVVILQNFNYKEYFMFNSYMLLENLKRFVVNRGGGIVLIGGELSYSEGDYWAPPLNTILPVTVFYQKGQIDPNPVKLKITETGLTNSITDLGLSKEEAKRLWSSLPPVDGVNIVGRLVNNGRALLVHPEITNAGEPMAVVSVNKVGRGRVLSIATDSFWKYAFLTGDNEELRGLYYKFWRRSIRWLINDKEFKQVKLRLSKLVVLPGDKVKVSVNAFYNNSTYVPMKNIILSVIDSFGKSYSLAVTGANGLYSAVINAPSFGSYKVKLTVKNGNEDIASDESFLLVKNPEAEEKRITSISLTTLPGNIITEIPYDKLRKLLTEDESGKIVTAKINKKLYNYPPLLFLLLLIFYLFFIGRRLSGLI